MAVVRAKTQSMPGVASQGPSSLARLVGALDAAGLYMVPIRVLDAAEMLGLEVVEELMDDDISGYLEFKNGRWIVGVNALHHKNRQRFTIAHEIAHYVLHRDRGTNFVDQTFARREGGRTQMESEADMFAAELLMPAAHLRKQIDGGVTSLEELADVFQVSTLAMRYRVRNLGYTVK